MGDKHDDEYVLGLGEESSDVGLSRESSDVEAQILTGDGKWWEFLDPETYQKPEGLQAANRTTSDQLDWSRAPERRRAGPVGFSFFTHCADCGQGVPPDFTFCVQCGGDPRSNRRPEVFSLVLKSFDNPQAQGDAADLIVQSGVDLERAEITRILDQPPAVFNVVATQDQVAALTAKLAEVGISAKGFAVEDASVPWVQETFESIFRQPPKLGVFALLAAATALGWVAAWWLSIVGIVALVAFFVRELIWYQSRYALQINRLLELVTGFDHETAMVARETLRSMSDREARGYVTSCLMEYYSLTQQIRAHAAVYGEVLSRSQRALGELMADVLGLAHRYARMDDFVAQNPPAALEQKIGRLQDSLPSDQAARAMSERQITVLQGQLEAVRTMDASRQTFRERLRALATSMESLRHRIATVRVQPSEEAWRELHMEEALRELEDEFTIFEETLEVVEA